MYLKPYQKCRKRNTVLRIKTTKNTKAVVEVSSENITAQNYWIIKHKSRNAQPHCPRTCKDSKDEWLLRFVRWFIVPWFIFIYSRRKLDIVFIIKQPTKQFFSSSLYKNNFQIFTVLYYTINLNSVPFAKYSCNLCTTYSQEFKQRPFSLRNSLWA
jgi:hypothetical protein